MNPMQAAAASKKPPISHKNVKDVFSITETLYNYHSMLLEGLERRITSFNKNTTLGDYIYSMADFLRCYPQYVNGYDVAIEILTVLEEQPAFVDFLRKLTNNQELKGLNLYSYLIMPVQRIPRYILLLTDLRNKTPEYHPDHQGLQKALQKISEIADWIDEQKLAYDLGQRLIALGQNILNLPKGMSIVQPGRVIVKTGDVDTADGAVHIILFNDLLLVTKKVVEDEKKKKKKKDDTQPPPPQKYLYVSHIDLTIALVHEYPANNTYNNALSLSHDGHTYLIQFPSPKDKEDWFAEFSKYCEQAKKRPGSYRPQ